MIFTRWCEEDVNGECLDNRGDNSKEEECIVPPPLFTTSHPQTNDSNYSNDNGEYYGHDYRRNMGYALSVSRVFLPRAIGKPTPVRMKRTKYIPNAECVAHFEELSLPTPDKPDWRKPYGLPVGRE